MVRSFVQKKFPQVEIKEAENGEEGVDVAKKERPDVSLVDIRLPGIDGIETARQIKKNVPECQIIAMSMFKQNAVQELIDRKIIFVNKEEIDSKLIPLLSKFLNGHKT